MKKRVAVTGLGVIAPNGIGKEAFWEAIKSGKSGVDRITRFDPSPYPTTIAAEVKDFDPGRWMDEKDLVRTDRSTQFAVACARMAADDAGLESENGRGEMMGVSIGTTLGGMSFALREHSVSMMKGPMEINPFFSWAVPANASSAQISYELSATGPSQSFSTFCASSFSAIGYGYQCIREGRAKIMVVGGTDAPLHPTIFSSACLSRVISRKNTLPPQTPAPFDLHRDGTVFGEGAGMLVLEELERARGRGARIYAEIAGFGITCDAYHMVKPDPSGESAVRAVLMALEDAGVKAADIDFIHAHGAATLMGDRIEAVIIRKSLGKYSIMIPVTCIKSMIGHTQGADGAIEAIACLLALQKNLIPPIINYEHPDSHCMLDIVHNGPRETKINTVLLNCFAFGGKNVVLVMKRV